ncbi:MAG: hypothetical protein V1754_14610, partial [Pseudomonadota bacterium]
ARSTLNRIREEIHYLQVELEQNKAKVEQLNVLDEFQGINLAEYSLEEKRAMLSIVVREVSLRFDRMFITYNLYEEPGKLYTRRVDITRTISYNSRLRRK